MRTRPLLGRMGYWLRQFNDTSERHLDAILDTLTGLGGGDCLCLKVADGMNFQGLNDEAGLTPVFSVEDITNLRDACHQRHVAFLPVVVPRGRRPADEAALHGRIAAAIGALMVDLEAGTGFWDGSPTTGIPQYTAALRAAAGDAYLINQPDSRNLDSVFARQTAPDFDAFAAQHYVGMLTADGQSCSFDRVDVEVGRFNGLAGLGRDMYVTLFGEARLDRLHLMVEFWEQVRGRCLGANLFAFGDMNAAQLRTGAALRRPDQAPEPLGGTLDPTAFIKAALEADQLRAQADALALAASMQQRDACLAAITNAAIALADARRHLGA